MESTLRLAGGGGTGGGMAAGSFLTSGGRPRAAWAGRRRGCGGGTRPRRPGGIGGPGGAGPTTVPLQSGPSGVSSSGESDRVRIVGRVVYDYWQGCVKWWQGRVKWWQGHVIVEVLC